MKLFKDDSYTSMFFKIMTASLPFITIGMLGNRLVMYISCAVGGLALIGGIARLCSKSECSYRTELSRDVDEILQLPYAIALSSCIASAFGIKAEMGLWFALALSVFIVLGNHIKPKE